MLELELRLVLLSTYLALLGGTQGDDTFRAVAAANSLQKAIPYVNGTFVGFGGGQWS